MNESSLDQSERPIMRAAVYVRAVRDNTSDVDTSVEIERQRKAAKELAQQRGFEIEGEYIDVTSIAPAHTARSPLSSAIATHKDIARLAAGRPQLARLLKDARCEGVDVLIAFSPDRLSRSAVHLESLVAFLDRCSTHIAFCQGELHRPTLSALAQLGVEEQQHALVKALHGRLVRALEDGDEGGALPYGYERISETQPAHRVVVVPEQAKVVLDIFTLNKRGFSYGQIAALLNEEDIPSPAGGIWYRGTVRRIILGVDKYAGGRRGESKQSWPVIVDVTALVDGALADSAEVEAINE
ncbi:recombinase family protein [Chloroflexales bacterium ZM16-3]|nr:recombinase family protein [Chloroflexales bacterium ZM16-3]